jgi:hypothetical protein
MNFTYSDLREMLYQAATQGDQATLKIIIEILELEYQRLQKLNVGQTPVRS